jgi:hypothetical protein
MATAANIGWGKYNGYEGPFYRGKHHYKLPTENATEDDRRMAVLASTEGAIDAINMYDSCVISATAIQLCEKYFFVSNVLGSVASLDRSLIAPVDSQASSGGLDFKQRSDGRWRFFFRDARGEVNSLAEIRQCYLLNSTGKKGTWDDESKLYAKQWAAAVATVFENHDAQRVAVKFVGDRLRMFWAKFAKEFFANAPMDDPEALCAINAYTSFAANNPKYAGRHLRKFVETTNETPWTPPWVIGLLKELTFGPKIAIYPTRYNAIRKKLEPMYSIDLPDFATELRQWESDNGPAIETEEVQRILKYRLGFDLGNYGPNKDGVDGDPGGKTRKAVEEFQRRHGIETEMPGFVDAATRDALIAVDQAGEGIPAELDARARALVMESIARLSREAVANARTSAR